MEYIFEEYFKISLKSANSDSKIKEFFIFKYQNDVNLKSFWENLFKNLKYFYATKNQTQNQYLRKLSDLKKLEALSYFNKIKWIFKKSSIKCDQDWLKNEI